MQNLAVSRFLYSFSVSPACRMNFLTAKSFFVPAAIFLQCMCVVTSEPSPYFSARISVVAGRLIALPASPFSWRMAFTQVEYSNILSSEASGLSLGNAAPYFRQTLTSYTSHKVMLMPTLQFRIDCKTLGPVLVFLGHLI